ncbi:R3H and coiled-coil domain-containing protein 1 [Latimeria chalumnae]|uniref:R3H and coiled-coil domain-containing protein 1 n=1 Tax=Latimeria chalumnae TaxID=7897 RepID=UPI0003C12250|nr:PREDICTED: R3H and coiled-coil domain-containing protein 1 [Latimeria chalumnae]XP_005991935.1 PREDICTED: R3H and coiled-coil domain-containing protein 1 [Latimeria chalumnae]XP_005991936.1 PREDICTED: R3H and coiled-coil domain-containing protein 1 [Latimeria chalumnae]XP_014341523.1 PREDICTED: R3H and coiled-coil domain-containing protein 1 [Latimeria chalumnae]XP_014341524.1 PREDICTED: R3H and coiled-coil domain-containing protein 1 [Latimeria chalumnae]|eukprot:XP_005991934.1 PREDICTED: R3H and coiled-coil domain-containing protein 1 [Latimeria chalumnae]
MFPPLSSRLRYLIHRTVENFSALSSFSIGEGNDRRTVVCHIEIRLPSEEDSLSCSVNNMLRAKDSTQPSNRGSRENERSCKGTSHSIAPASKSKLAKEKCRESKSSKRPEKALYVPRALRQGTECVKGKASTASESQRATEEIRKEELAECLIVKKENKNSLEHPVTTFDSKGLLNERCTICSGKLHLGACGTEQTQELMCPCAFGKEHSQLPPHSATSGKELSQEESICPGACGQNNSQTLKTLVFPSTGGEKPLQDLKRRRKDEPLSQSDCSYGFGSAMTTSLPSEVMDISTKGQIHIQSDTETLTEFGKIVKVSTATEEEKKLGEDGDDQLIQEIITNLTEKSIQVQKLQFDYSSLGSVQIGDLEFGHVIEIYGFPPELKTEDLVEAFSDFQDYGFKLYWVDDTHAIGVFSSQTAALDAVALKHPLLKVRPLSEGTRQSKLKASNLTELLLPTKKRPHADLTAAKRLVTRALGLQNKGSRMTSHTECK